jgi:starvation-inducible DNA-binding protein
MSLPHRTRIDLPRKTREKMVVLLNERLADALDLRSQVKQAHWTVRGANFIAIHELFDRIAGEIDGYADEIAERAMTLGGTVSGTVRASSRASSLKEYPAGISAEDDHIAAAADRLAAFGALARAAIESAEEAGDAATADLFTQVARGIDKSTWFLEAHARGR